MYVACFNLCNLSVNIILCVLMYLLYLYVRMYVTRSLKEMKKNGKLLKTIK